MPFKNREKWTKALYIIAILFACLSLPANGVGAGEWGYDVAVGITAIVTLIIYPIVGISSVIYVIFKLREPHISPELQKSVVKRHILQVSSFLVYQCYWSFVVYESCTYLHPNTPVFYDFR